MSSKSVTVYADTSVFGGAFDDEFAEASLLFFEQVRRGRFALVTSGIVRAEIQIAPQEVRDLFQEMLVFATVVDPSAEVLCLSRAYIEAGIVTQRSANDAMHVAMATVTGCAVIVSWNFKHIVHFRKIPRYNAVNAALGYGNLAIFSPCEVIDYEDEEGV